MLREKGNILSEDIKGDIKLFIKIENTTQFERKGIDLIMNKNISLKDALCGFSFELKYIKNKSVIQNFRRVSKPGRRIYVTSKALYKLNLPIGFFILSTSQGILTSSDAKLKFIGGEVLCHIL